MYAATFVGWTTSASAQRFELQSGEVVTAGDPILINALDLPPDTDVELRAERVLKNYYQRGFPVLRYQSSALFRSDGNGRIDLTTSPATSGSYQGADPLGLFRSMQPVNQEPVEADKRITLTALIDGTVVASTSFEMRHAPLAFHIEEVASLPGSYFAPQPGPGKHPVIIIAGGADTNRQNREVLMPQLVAKGYSVFHFATYEIIYGPGEPSVEGLPTRYVDIPIDRLQDVRDWLTRRADVDPDRMGLYGYSRNGAYVLLAATRFDWVKAVAGISPSDVVWEGWGDGVRLGTTSSYSWNGQPLEYVPYSENWYRETGKFARGLRGRLRTPMDEGRWANPDRVEAARIPIEDYTGSVLVVGGELDDLWSAGHMVQNIAERRAEAGLATSLLVLPEAGHGITGTGYNPTLLFEEGARRRAEAHGQAQTWGATLEFFKEALSP
ncbi:acyl-CoA thioesterase/BAAT N-terminal domain-containing protein [Pontixanthobacter sp. CEM42]|uniref:acyl-CoA thioesterase/BAAT N-terminal domain-containing protein n=1 Tax=Pontixanthobacter sp. CEM42 TaxID=2792077 RepID=UPI001AE04E0A|nr:acyl-CoA thioesterase/BAAT N-terminal domain-containing protein [Pontixanthobacter sp. CEM42]